LTAPIRYPTLAIDEARGAYAAMVGTGARMDAVQRSDDLGRAGDPAGHWANLSTKWDRRARMAAEWLQAETAVADIGCGLMTLEPYLARGTRYVPMDLVARDSRTLVFDLGKDRIPPVACGAAALLGVLEYIDDVPFVLEQLTRFPRSLISYNQLSPHDLLWKLHLRPKRVDWRHRYSKSTFRRLLRDSGLKIARERKVRIGETLFEVVPARPPADPTTG